jgi:hypothetical protein
MDLIEFNTHSFIVKIWLEEPAQNSRKGKWRGHITHVPSGERRYLKSLGEITAFIVPYLISMGVRLEGIWRLRYLLRRGQGMELPEVDPAGEGGHRSQAMMPAPPDPSSGRPVEQ